MSDYVLKATHQAEFSGITADILLGPNNAPMTAMKMTVATGMGAPAHISADEDKVFQITEGNLVFLVGDDKFEVGPGEYVFVPKGVVHGFTALDATSSIMTLVSTPARHDQFFTAMGKLPVPHQEQDVQAVCEEFGQQIVGPNVAP